jgi:hypothetical protein
VVPQQGKEFMQTKPNPNLIQGLVTHCENERPGITRLPLSGISANFGLAPVLGLLAWLFVAVPLAGLAAPGITISTHGSIGPINTSPSWSNWFNNAVVAVQSGVTSSGNQVTDPTAWVERTSYRYVEVIETIDSDPRVTLGFNAWLGIADPSGAAAQEINGGIVGVARILGNGSKIKLSQYRWVWSDDGGAFSITNSTAPSQYNNRSRGIDYGPDGKLGGGDDIIYSVGDTATNLVDEIVTAIGFYYNQTGDFPTAPAGLTHQQTLNWADDFITKNDNYANSNTMGFYMYDDNSALLTSATLHFNIIAQPTLYIAKTTNQLNLSWGGAGFLVENSPVLGPAASWTAIPGGTNSPVNLPSSGGNASFWRLRSQ